MDEALELADYLPVSFKTPSEQDYISFLWETFQENYNGDKYQFAFLCLPHAADELRLFQGLADQADAPLMILIRV